MCSHPVMINREDFLHEFHQMMQPHSDMRVMRLLGEGKMGKSHLLTKVLPKIIAEHFPAYHSIIVDMRRETQTVPDYLYLLKTLLEKEPGMTFPDFDRAYQDWLNRPKINVSGLSALLARVNISARGEEDEARRFIPKLTSAFATDVHRHVEKRVVFMFDTVEQVSEFTQGWLMDMLLVHLARLEHVRVIVAGRSLPDANGSYAARCANFVLHPVREEQAYIDFCHVHAPSLEDSVIRALARAFDYRPGAFAEALGKVAGGRI